jgi:hypothetical protein
MATKMLATHHDFIHRMRKIKWWPIPYPEIVESSPHVYEDQCLYFYRHHPDRIGFWATAQHVDQLPAEPYLSILLLPHIEFEQVARLREDEAYRRGASDFFSEMVADAIGMPQTKDATS